MFQTTFQTRQLARCVRLTTLLALALTTVARSQELAELGNVSLVLDARGLTGAVNDIAFCPNGTMLAACAGQEVRVWDSRDGRRLRTLRGEIGRDGYGDCLSVAFSRDNCELVVGVQAAEGRGAVRIYDIRNITEIDSVISDLPAAVTGLAFSQDGRFLVAACGNGALVVYDWPLRQVVGSVAAGVHPAAAFQRIGFPLDAPVLLAYGPNGATLLSIPGCRELPANNDLPARLARWVGNLTDVQQSFGREFASCAWRLDQDVWLAYGKTDGRDGHWAACWSGANAKPRVVYEGHDQEITACALSADCGLAATGDRRGEVQIWRTGDGELIQSLKGVARPIYRAALDAQAQHLGFTLRPLPPGQFGWNRYGQIDQMFDFGGRVVLPAAAGDFLEGERTSRGGSLQVTYSQGTYGMRFRWPAAARADFSLENNATPTSFSLLKSERHDIDYPALVGDKNGGLALVDPGTGNRRVTYVGHQAFITSLCESEDGRCFTSSSTDGTVRLWNLVDAPAESEPVLTCLLGERGEWIVWTPQGFYDAAPGCGDLVGWHVNRGPERSALFYPLHQFRDQLYRPDIIQLVLRSASVETAIQEVQQIAADPARPIPGAGADDVAQVAPLSTPVPITTDFRQPQTMREMHPPRIRLVSPQDGAVVQDGQIHVLAEIVAENDLPIQEVRLLVNGRPSQDKGVDVVGADPTADGRISFSRAVALLPGENQITLLASNGVARSNPMTVSVRYEAPADVLNVKPNLHLLSVGISQYKDAKLNLKYAHLDAESFAAAWQDQRGPVYQQLTSNLLTNDAATGLSIQDAMSHLVEEVQQRDVAVIFISAHGIRDRQLEYFVAPHDVDPENLTETGLHFSAIGQLLESLPCKVLLFVDTCHAAGITGAKSIWRDPLYELTSAEYGTIVFASSLSREISVEDEAWGHGAFTRAILDTFDDVESDLDDDGFLSLTEFEQSVSERVAEMTKGQQHPVMQRPATIHNIPFYRVAKP